MRLLLAMMKHETNTFSPVLTDLARFSRAGGKAPDGGAAAIAAYRGTGTVTGAFIEIAEREGAEFDLAIAADAWPSGPVEDAAYEAIAAPILAAVQRGGYDGILLDLHGAMVTRSHEDGEGTLLARIRAIDPKTPIARRLRHARQRLPRDGASMPTSSPATRPIRTSTCTTPAGAPATR